MTTRILIALLASIVLASPSSLVADEGARNSKAQKMDEMLSKYKPESKWEKMRMEHMANQMMSLEQADAPGAGKKLSAEERKKMAEKAMSDVHEFEMKMANAFISENESFFNKPTRVDLYRIKPDKSKDPNEKTFHDYPIIEQRDNVSISELSGIKEIITNKQSYFSNTMCLFQPGLGIKFTREDKSMSVLVCFSCTDWLFVPSDSGNTFFSNFTPVQEQLKKEAIKFFPTMFDKK